MAADKPVTVTELKTFIEAVEFASDKEDWIPSERQWKRIRSMIDNLVPEKAAAPAEVYREVAPAPVMYAPSTFAPVPNNAGPGGYAAPPQMPMMAPTQQAPLQGPFAQGGPQPVRTPDLDTSHGKAYQSSFA